MEKKKTYLSAPLPFMGQKRMFIKEFRNVLKEFPDGAVYIDLFGGSGLLAHVTKREKPEARVVYNDFDNYRQRLENVGRTNALLAELRESCPKSCTSGLSKGWKWSRWITGSWSHSIRACQMWCIW